MYDPDFHLYRLHSQNKVAGIKQLDIAQDLSSMDSKLDKLSSVLNDMDQLEPLSRDH